MLISLLTLLVWLQFTLIRQVYNVLRPFTSTIAYFFNEKTPTYNILKVMLSDRNSFHNKPLPLKTYFSLNNLMRRSYGNAASKDLILHLMHFSFLAARSIYSTATANYDYTNQQIYIMDFNVNDGTDVSNTGYALLYISKNDPPKITNLGRKLTKISN